MSNFGNQVQLSVYQTMLNPDPKRLPVIYEDWEKKARDVLDDEPYYYYVAGGTGGRKTMDSNLSAFDRWKIVPRMLRNVEDRDLSVNLFGHTYNFPVLHAPMGVQSIIHEDGDLGSARACAEMGIPFTASSASTVPMGKIAAEMGDAPCWFQLYWSKDLNITASFSQRAEAWSECRSCWKTLYVWFSSCG